MIYAQRFGEVCRKALNKKERRQWAMEKPKLDNARTLSGFYDYQDTLVSLKPTTLRERTLGKPEARDQEDLVAEKGLFSLTHYNLAHKPKPTPRAMKISDTKAAVDKEWEKLVKLQAWQVTRVKSNTEIIEKAQKEKRTVHFATLMDLCHLKNSELEQKFKKT